MKGHAVDFSESDIDFLYSGDEKTLGLLKLCGTQNKFSDKLKNSSLTALVCLTEIIDLEKPKTFATVFYSLEAENYLMLKLNQHIAQDEAHKAAALTLARKIREKRPFLPPVEYLVTKTAVAELEAITKGAANPLEFKV